MTHDHLLLLFYVITTCARSDSLRSGVRQSARAAAATACVPPSVPTRVREAPTRETAQDVNSLRARCNQRSIAMSQEVGNVRSSKTISRLTIFRFYLDTFEFGVAGRLNIISRNNRRCPVGLLINNQSGTKCLLSMYVYYAK